MRPILTALLLLSLATLAGAEEGMKQGLSTKTFFMIDHIEGLDLARAADRDLLRARVNEKTLEFANAFVESLQDGGFADELDRLADVAGGGAARDKLMDFLGTLEPVLVAGPVTGALPPEKKEELKQIQLAWTMVQLVRYGAPGFRRTFDLGGDPGGAEEFLEAADGDTEFLRRIQEYENDYENFVEVIEDPDSDWTMDVDESADQLAEALIDAIGGAGLVNPPPANFLRALAQQGVSKYLTAEDEIWSIKVTWHGFSETSPAVRGQAQSARLASGAQVLSWSLPRMEFDDDEAIDEARKEIGKHYEFSLKGAGWEWWALDPSPFVGTWGAPQDGEMHFMCDPGSWPQSTAFVPPATPTKYKILESVSVSAEPVDMEVQDRSLVVSGQGTEVDTVKVQDVVKGYWKELESYLEPAKELDTMPGSVSAPAGSGSGGDDDPQNGRFSL